MISWSWSRDFHDQLAENPWSGDPYVRILMILRSTYILILIYVVNLQLLSSTNKFNCSEICPPPPWDMNFAESLLKLTYNSGVCVWLLLDTKGTLTRCRKVIFKESFSVIIFFWVINKKLMTCDPMISWLSFPMILVFFSFLDHQLFDPVIFKFKIWWSMDQKTVISWLWSQKWYDLVVMIPRKLWS